MYMSAWTRYALFSTFGYHDNLAGYAPDRDHESMLRSQPGKYRTVSCRSAIDGDCPQRKQGRLRQRPYSCPMSATANATLHYALRMCICLVITEQPEGLQAVNGWQTPFRSLPPPKKCLALQTHRCLQFCLQHHCARAIDMDKRCAGVTKEKIVSLSELSIQDGDATAMDTS